MNGTNQMANGWFGVSRESFPCLLLLFVPFVWLVVKKLMFAFGANRHSSQIGAQASFSQAATSAGTRGAILVRTRAW